MKKYIKHYIAALLILLGTSSVFAQHSGIWHFQYDMGIPMGNTKDFVSKFSARGFALEGQGYVTDNISIGGRFAWDVFYEDKGWTLEHVNYNLDGENKTGSDIYSYQKHYLNTMPLMATVHYTLNSDKVIPYFGLGVGTYYIEQRNQLGIYIFQQNKWHFGLSPEVGVTIPLGQTSNWGLNVNFRYNWAAKTKETDAQSWINTSVGFSYFW